jgi:DNA-binding transcriptional regulator LsrR (DeoR family)
MSVGPLSRVQLAHVAREHYVHGKSRVEIAEETGLSRFKVGRMLDEAIEQGIIRFEIVSSPGIDLDLSMRLKQRFGLEHAIVVELPVDTDAEAQSTLGAAAAGLVDELVGPDDIFGLTSGRTLNVMARQLKSLPCRSVVQLAGVAGPIQESGLEVIRRLSNFPGVQPWPIFASLVMSDAQTAGGMMRQPGISAAVEMFDEVTVAMCAVGSWVPPNSLMMMNPAISDDDRERIRRGRVDARDRLGRGGPRPRRPLHRRHGGAAPRDPLAHRDRRWPRQDPGHSRGSPLGPRDEPRDGFLHGRSPPGGLR